MYRFQWSALVTDALLSELRTLAGVAAGETLAGVEPALVSILTSTGGQPLVAAEPSPSERLAWALRLLGEAVSHTLGTVSKRRVNGGYRIARTGIAALGSVAKASARTPVNWATASEIAEATGVSPSLAESIVADRRAHGAFGSLAELDTRLRGVNVRNREHFGSALSFDEPRAFAAERVAPSGDLRTDLRTLLDCQADGTARQRLATALETVAASVARDPHPATRRNERRDVAAAVRPVPATECKWVGVLFAKTYYEAVQAIFADAKTSIDVCMFHVAFPSDGHPTRKLLDALIAAQARGVSVRVLLDRDRDSDPYRSTVINARARAALEAAGVPVRADSEARLLHSKFLVIDRELAIIGSHNWSEGSYFGFDDLTLVLASPNLATELRTRFDTLWSGGS